MRTRPIIRRSLLGALILAAVVAVPAGAAVSRFLDVPDESIFVADIEWMADSDVTRGCGPDLFCPKANVTREQMSAFLHRLAENKVVHAATAVTAESALSADHAASADSATTADHAATADAATTADHATSADSATTANHATTADSATTATSASTADSAATAGAAATAASATDSALLAGRAAATYDTFVIGDARHSGDMSGYLYICWKEELPGCPTWSSEGALLAEATFTTVAADSTMAVTGMTSLRTFEAVDPVDVYVWLQLDSSACTDSINAGATAAYVRQSLPTDLREAVSVTIAFEIPTVGEHTVALCAQPWGGNVAVLASTISGVVSSSPNSVTSQHFVAP